ncbi:MAG TPA: phytanoyl-CoA dioxygenase family protein [Pyrinomonadaceae bacterium]|nr:phytanoyl-CoA dioxygenase family protein [Pyrinomonadaceae bacterium]
MRNAKEIPLKSNPPRPWQRSRADRLAAELETNGIVVLPSIVSPEQLRGMQLAFESRLRRIRWNNFEGYQRTELYRHMVEDVLVLDQGFIDLALHPLVKEILTRYLGTEYELTEAKGWKSLPTTYDFHGWHGDTWYDQAIEQTIHREIKLGMYLTDVKSGAFKFIKGSHRQQHPRNLNKAEARALPLADLFELSGPAGTVFMFDTSAIHRQSIPILEPRQAIFFGYHDPKIPLQPDDIDYYRYHPLLLNAAFLGDLSTDDQRILGFGNKTNFQPAFQRQDQPPLIYEVFATSHGARLHIQHLQQRIVARLKRVFRRS